MSAATTFGALAPGARFRLLPAGEVWCKVDGLARDYAGPMVDPRDTGYAIAEDRKVHPVTDAEYLEHLRGEIRAERISWGELADLQGMAELIDPGDVELLEWAGVPELPDVEPPCPSCGGEITPSSIANRVALRDGRVYGDATGACPGCGWRGTVPWWPWADDEPPAVYAVAEVYDLVAGEAVEAHPFHPRCAPSGAIAGDPLSWDDATGCERCGRPIQSATEEDA